MDMMMNTRLTRLTLLKADYKRSAPLLLLCIGLLLITSCTSTSAPVKDVAIAPAPIDSTAIYAALQHEKDSILTAFFVQQYIDNLTSEAKGMIRGQRLFSDVMLPDLYDSFGYQLIWTDAAHRLQAIGALQMAYRDGLVPADYHLEAIEELTAQQAEARGRGDEIGYEAQAGLDLLITDGIIYYGHHLLNGKTDSKTLEPHLKYEQRVLADTVLQAMRAKLERGEVQSIITELRPPSDYYRHMMAGLEDYRNMADSGGWKPLYVKERKLEPGEQYAVIPKVRERLRLEGDLYGEDLDAIADSTYDPTLYDSDLQRAVERFQVRHGLNADGVIGKGTVEMMNIPVDKKVNLLLANMERARWIHHDLDSNYILVNIAGFDLRLVKGDTLCWTTRVMTGKVTSATPVFRDEMQYIDVNPYWTVPFSISNGEMLPKLKKDPTYLKRNGMELLTMGGSVVADAGVDFSQYEAKMPYIVKQGPGNGNSLGRIKFLFPNKHSVYLHDTPSKSLFAREGRAFSHGCIRVEQPFELAANILAGQGYSASKLDSIRDARENYRIVLDQRLPVMITYSTAFADADLVYFYKDVYKRDPALLRALDL